MRINVRGCAIAAIILAVVGILVGIIIGITVWRGRVWRAKLTAEAPAVVTNVVLRERRRRRGGTSYETIVDYSYSVGGRSYTGQRTESGNNAADYRAGARRKVCYNPSDHSDSLLVPPDYQCGQ